MSESETQPVGDVGSDAPSEPVLRVVTPDATAEEIAAIVTVFAALGSRARPPRARPRSEWAAPHRVHRIAHAPAPGAWRASGLPR